MSKGISSGRKHSLPHLTTMLLMSTCGKMFKRRVSSHETRDDFDFEETKFSTRLSFKKKSTDRLVLVRVLKILQSDTENRISDLEILLFWKNVVPTDDEEEDTEVPEEQKMRKERNKRHREGSLAIMQCGMSERVGILVSQIRWF